MEIELAIEVSIDEVVGGKLEIELDGDLGGSRGGEEEVTIYSEGSTVVGSEGEAEVDIEIGLNVEIDEVVD